MFAEGREFDAQRLAAAIEAELLAEGGGRL
jgi:hypothetical protein